jgi:hypothetical protein
LAAGVALAGVGLAGTPDLRAFNARAVRGATLHGPYLNLTTAGDAATGRARLLGNVDPAGVRYGWFDGSVMALAPSGELRPFCGFRGFSVTRLVSMTPVAGWLKVHREMGCHYDLESGRILENMNNPFTGEHVGVTDSAFEWQEEITTDLTADRLNAAWRVEGDRLLIDHLHRFSAIDLRTRADDPSLLLRFSQAGWHATALDDMQNEELKLVYATGVWTRSVPWPFWLRMGEVQGHCLYQCTFAGGVEHLEALPKGVLDEACRRHEQWLEAPRETAKSTRGRGPQTQLT